MNRTRHLLILLLLLTATAASARIAGERPVSDPVYGLAPGGKREAVVATDGDGFLVAWGDVRAWPGSTYVARVTARGEVLDPTGIRIAQGSTPQLVFAGDAYVVLWIQRRMY